MTSRRPLPPRRSLGDTVSLPIDTSSHAFRRTHSEPRFSFERTDKSSVLIKEIPICLQWRSARDVAGRVPEMEGRTTSPRSAPGVGNPIRNMAGPPLSVSGEVHDPHRTGFGRIPPKPTRVRSPPLCKLIGGILGVHPCTETRVEDLEVEDDGVRGATGEGNPPIESAHLGFGCSRA